jgi:hypothetical protein
MYLSSRDNAQVVDIAGGRAGVLETLAHMRRMVREAKRDYFIRRKAEQLVEHVPQKDWPGEARAIHAFVRDSIAYRLDPNEIELVKTPVKVLETGAGDCDDKSVLVAALLESIGHPTRLVAIGFTPGELTHVYVETKIGNRWFALETTEPLEFGDAVSGFLDREIVHI